MRCSVLALCWLTSSAFSLPNSNNRVLHASTSSSGSRSTSSLCVVSRKTSSSSFQQYSHKTVVKNEAINGTTLLDFLVNTFQVKRTQAKQWLSLNCVVVNYEIRSQFNFNVLNDDMVGVLSQAYIQASTKYGLPIGLTILIEDSSIIALDKVSGMPNQANSTSKTSHSVLSYIHKYFNTKSIKIKDKEKAFLVSADGATNGATSGTSAADSALETDLSGIVIIAKTQGVRTQLQRGWSSFGATYSILCKGAFASPNGQLTSPSGASGAPLGAVGLLSYRLLESSVVANESVSLIEVSPLEHMTEAAILHTLHTSGHTVLGYTHAVDDVNSSSPLGRICMHVTERRLTHPVTREMLTLRSALPESFAFLMSRAMNQRTAITSAPGELASEGGRNVKVLSLDEFLGKTNASGARKEGGRRQSPS